jgi:hypothetical protein
VRVDAKNPIQDVVEVVEVDVGPVALVRAMSREAIELAAQLQLQQATGCDVVPEALCGPGIRGFPSIG